MKTKEIDYFIKDEGEFFTLILMSKKAKELFRKDNERLYNTSYGNEVIKIDLLNEERMRIISWGVSHNLYGETH